jgi:predicted RNase H-like HicB family nuclease
MLQRRVRQRPHSRYQDSAPQTLLRELVAQSSHGRPARSPTTVAWRQLPSTGEVDIDGPGASMRHGARTITPEPRDNRTCFSKEFFMELTDVLTHAEEGGFVALNPETGTTTQGETVEEAVAKLKEATALYLSDFPMPSPGHPVITMFTVPEPVHA